MALLRSMSREEGRLTTNTLANSASSGKVRLRRRIAGGEPARVVIFFVLLLISAVMFFPFVYMVINSFRTQQQYLQGSGFSTQSWHLLFQEMPVGTEFLNSTIVAACAIVLILIVATSAGFAFAKLRFRFHYVVFIGIVGAMMVPVQSIIIPEYVNFARFGLINNYVSAILTYTALGSSILKCAPSSNRTSLNLGTGSLSTPRIARTSLPITITLLPKCTSAPLLATKSIPVHYAICYLFNDCLL